MEQLHAILLTLLESTFLFIALAMLHSQRKAIGRASFYMASGLIILFAIFVTAADCRMTLIGQYEFQIGPTVLFFPMLAALLLVYITEGTLAAQRMIIGAVVLYGCYLYLAEITRLECGWLGFSINSSQEGATLELLLRESRSALNVFAAIYFLDFFIAPVCYTRLRNFGFPRLLCIWGALFLAQFSSILLMELLGSSFGFTPGLVGGSFLARTVGSVWLGVLLVVYLLKIERENLSPQQSPLDLLFAFFGSYGRSKVLEANLREWEERYQLVLEYAGELVLLLSPDGTILEGNISAGRIFGANNPKQLEGQPLFPRLRITDSTRTFSFDSIEKPRTFHGVLDEQAAGGVFLSGTISPLTIRNRRLLVLIGRDITEETRLASEKQELSDQLAHSQRLESLGLLAGGIAHDFNNYIHAILGHVDVVSMLYPPESPDAAKHLEKVTEIAEQAGHLTSQLLGFARKGKYQLTSLAAREVLERSLGLLGFRGNRELEISLRTAPETPDLKGDSIQLQQVLLNLMLNAIYSMKDNTGDKLLSLYAAPATQVPIAWKPPPEKSGVLPEDYVYLMVKDNGCGMSKEVKTKIFEPFFTTKPVGEGTGMGLSMVYGTISNHNGWIQVESEPGRGSAFYLFLPVAKPENVVPLEA